MKILITGANGFVGSNLDVALRHREGIDLLRFDINDTEEQLQHALGIADVVFHLAGANRPKVESEFLTVNTELTHRICDHLRSIGRAPKIVFASSIHAECGNAYGHSKLLAEQALEQYAISSGASAVVFRLNNLFGKWCRPNYNSVTATFCHNIAHGLPIEISDPQRLINLTYIDAVIAAFEAELGGNGAGFRFAEPLASTEISLGELADLVRGFLAQRTTLVLPNFSVRFVRELYATYLSYVDASCLSYSLAAKHDPRGSLAEFIKQPSFGQIFVSRTKPGITRGNHHHATKTEKFLVVEGEAVVRLRHINGQEVQSFTVRGEEYRVVDIPPGYTHSIENVGTNELVTLFWASEVFDPMHPDTFGAPVVL